MHDDVEMLVMGALGTPTQRCRTCERVLPAAHFYYKGGVLNHYLLSPDCRDCFNQKLSTMNKAKRQAARTARKLVEKPQEPVEPLKLVAKPLVEVRACAHLFWYTGTDEFIERMVPGFFETHEHAAFGMEWHVCKWCHKAKGPFPVISGAAIASQRKGA